MRLKKYMYMYKCVKNYQVVYVRSKKICKFCISIQMFFFLSALRHNSICIGELVN